MGTLTEKRPDATSGSGKRMKMSARDAVGLIRRAKRRGAKVDVKPALAKPTGPVQKKAGCSLCAMAGGSGPETAPAGYSCPLCSGKGGAAGPALEAPRDSVQRKGAGTADAAEAQADALGARIGAELGGAGSVSSGPIPSGVRSVAERHLGVGLGGTELRADAGAHSRTASVGALAMTEGSTVSFGAGQLSTSTAAGRSLIGHELTHVAQQRAHGTAARQGFFGDDGDDAGLIDGAGALGSGGGVDALSDSPSEGAAGGVAPEPVPLDGGAAPAEEEGSPDIPGLPELRNLPPIVTPFVDPADGSLVVPLPGGGEVRVPFQAVPLSPPAVCSDGGGKLCGQPPAVPVDGPALKSLRGKVDKPRSLAQGGTWTCWANTAASILQSSRIAVPLSPDGVPGTSGNDVEDIVKTAAAQGCTVSAGPGQKGGLPSPNSDSVLKVWLGFSFPFGQKSPAWEEAVLFIVNRINENRYVYLQFDSWQNPMGFVATHAVVVWGYLLLFREVDGAVVPQSLLIDYMDPKDGEHVQGEPLSGKANAVLAVQSANGATQLPVCKRFCSCFDPCPPASSNCARIANVPCGQPPSCGQ